MLCAFLILAGSSRAALDFVRFYEEGDILLRAAGSAFTVHQAIGVALVAAGISGLLGLRRRAPGSAPR